MTPTATVSATSWPRASGQTKLEAHTWQSRRCIPTAGRRCRCRHSLPHSRSRWTLWPAISLRRRLAAARSGYFWTALFLAVLAFGEIGLDYYSELGGRPWRTVAAALITFVAGMGVLRFLYLATVGATGVITALVGAALFTAATAGFLVIGYRALRAAEKFTAWQARRSATQARREVVAAEHRMHRLQRDHDRLTDAYVNRIRSSLLDRCPADQLSKLEMALRKHLAGE